MSRVRPLLTALNAGGRYAYREPEMQVDHLVIGGGVVGLAIANALAHRWPSKSTYLVERHAQIGQETSSRNSEVIHAGLYYPRDSLKTRFCTRGRQLLYDRIRRVGSAVIGSKQVGKLVVGTGEDAAYLAARHRHCEAIAPHGPPTRLLSGDEARAMEPALSPAIEHALYSPTTGIVSAHDLMGHLAAELAELPDGTVPDAHVVVGTSVVRIDPHTPRRTGAKAGNDGSQVGFVVQLRTHDAAHSDTDALLARVVVNAAGLNAPRVLNALWDKQHWLPMYFAKGSYASYKGPGVEGVEHLLYPTPHLGKGRAAGARAGAGAGAGAGAEAVHSLGTHLTLDLDGHVRFGPDIAWLSAPERRGDMDARGPEHDDFWAAQLAPDASEAWLSEMHRAIQAYLPGVDRAGLCEDYAGIRPKLGGPDAPFIDFGVLWHRSRDVATQPVWQTRPDTHAPHGWLVSLVGIESPGLTSALAIGEHVAHELEAHVWGTRDPVGPARTYVDDVGHDALDAWA